MAEIKVSVKGLKELQKGIRKLGKEGTERVGKKVFPPIASDAKRRARLKVSGEVLNVRSGRLKSHIAGDSTATSVSVGALHGSSPGTIWESMGRPFLQPALQESLRGFERAFIQEWEKEIFRGKRL